MFHAPHEAAAGAAVRTSAVPAVVILAAESRLKKYPLHMASTNLVVMAGNGALGFGKGLDDVAETVKFALTPLRCLGFDRAGKGYEVSLMINPAI